MKKITAISFKEAKQLRKTFVVLVAVAIFALMSGVAFAADPNTAAGNYTYTEKVNTPAGSGYAANTPVPPAGDLAGASRWTYKDNYDGSKKTEGSYNAFQDQTNQLYDYDATGRDSGPHGGYDTSSNKCKTCHAVHRATGTFALMRVDTPDQACEYCHVGDHRHSVVNAYWQAGTIYPTNGHTIGSGSEIPDSSVWQWEETQTVSGGDNQTFDVRARRYDPQKNKVMRWTMHGGKFIRVGPTLLRCQSCHQVHNAYRQVWKPAMSLPATGDPRKAGNTNGSADSIWTGTTTKWTRGYKLLRLSPSGGIASTGATSAASRTNFTFYEAATTSEDPRLKVVELATVDVRPDKVPYNDFGQTTITVGSESGQAWRFAGGVNRTGYTVFRYHGDNKKPTDSNADDPAIGYNTIYGNVPVYETSLSFFCADCHNLNIAGKDSASSALGVGKFGNSMLGDRSHNVPFMITRRNTGTTTGTNAGASSGFHCYTCHNNDMPRINGTSNVDFDFNSDGTIDATASITAMGGNNQCGACHISPRMYAAYKQTYRQFQGINGGPSYSDFPHSGPSFGLKLLNAATTQTASTWDTIEDGTYEATPASVRTPYTDGADGLDKICLICHGAQGNRSIGYDK